MRTALDDAALFQHHDAVGVLDGREAVCNHERGAARHEAVHALLHQRFGARVDRARRLVENQHGRIGHGRAGDGEQLPLALREVCTVAREHRPVAVRQAADEAVRVCQLGGGHAFLVGGVQPPVADVVHHRAGEQVGVLQHDAERTAQVRLLDLVDVDAVIADFAVRNVIEPVDEVRDGRLSRAGGADEGDFLARHGIELDVVQHNLALFIAEVHVVEGDVPLQLFVGHAAVCLVRMLPRPHVRALPRLRQGAVAVFLRFLYKGIIINHNENRANLH